MPEFRLEITGPDSSWERVLAGVSETIGRAADNHIVLDGAGVSRSHARLDRRDGDVFLVDEGSANGTSINGSMVDPANAYPLQDGDRIGIGPYTLVFRAEDFAGTVLNAMPAEGMTVLAPRVSAFNLSGAAPVAELKPAAATRLVDLDGRASITIGRDPGCEVSIDDATVSRRHARIQVVTRDQHVIEDLGSSNGTFLDGRRLTPGQPATLVAGARIQVGKTQLVYASDALEQLDEAGRLRLDAVGLNRYVSPGVNLLHDISLTIRPREFVVIVGPSGSGKSTLLGALSGFRPASSGSVTVNDSDLYANFDAFRNDLGLVPQDDIIHRELSVEASLEYAARLRLAPDLSARERAQRVDGVMNTLGLAERRGVAVGRLSGGQRKRVSIGVELLTQPGLFFLDEATSGLDPATEAQMMRLLRGLADEGHTIVLVTHATKNVKLCDQICFLASGGYLAYYGPPAEALRYFEVDDFDSVYERLATEDSPPEWGRRFRASSAYETNVLERFEREEDRRAASEPVADLAAPSERHRPAPLDRKRPSVSSLHQFWVLTSRNLAILRNDRANLALLFLIGPVLASIDLIAWPRQVVDPVAGDLRGALTMFFLAALIPFLVGSLGSVREIVKEAPIYERERTVTLRVVPYVSSKVAVGLLFSVYNAAAFTLIKVVAVDLSSLALVNLLQIYVTTLLVLMSGVLAGLLISALVSREDRATQLVPAIVVLQLVFSGGLLPLSNLGVAGDGLGAVTSVNWGFRAMTAAAEIDIEPCQGLGILSCELPGSKAFGTDLESAAVIATLEPDFGEVLGTDIYLAWGAMAAITGAIFMVLVVVQKRKDVV